MSLLEVTSVLGNLGEFLGSIAVLITLVFLLMQIKQGKEILTANTDALDLSNRLQIADSWDRLNSELREIDKMFVTDEGLRSVWVAGETELNDLSSLDRMKYQRLFNIHLYTHLSAFSRARLTNSPELEVYTIESFKNLLESEGGCRQIWEHYDDLDGDGFKGLGLGHGSQEFRQKINAQIVTQVDA